MKFWPLGVALLCFILGWVLHGTTVDPHALEQADSLAAARQHILALKVILAADSAARDSAAKVNARNAVLAATAKRQAARGDSIAGELRAVLGGVRRADFDAYVATRDSADANYQSQISSLQTIVTFLSVRLSVADSAVAARDKLLDAYKVQLDAALKRGSPRCLLGPGATVGIHGWALGAGITCRV